MAGAHRPDVTAIPLGRPSPSASSNQPERQANGQGPAAFEAPRVAPIRFCSRRGLPCRRRCRPRGALLPHPFTLAVTLKTLRPATRRFAFCGAFPGVSPAGRYPAPHPYGARTFLRFEAAAVRPTGGRGHRGLERRRSSGIGRGGRTGGPLRAAGQGTEATLVHCSFTRIMGLCRAPGSGPLAPPHRVWAPLWAKKRSFKALGGKTGREISIA